MTSINLVIVANFVGFCGEWMVKVEHAVGDDERSDAAAAADWRWQ